jgi:hypothetical protein
MDESGLEMKWCFTVTPKIEGDRAWTLCTETKEERRIWMLRVTNQVHQASLEHALPQRVHVYRHHACALRLKGFAFTCKSSSRSRKR